MSFPASLKTIRYEKGPKTLSGNYGRPMILCITDRRIVAKGGKMRGLKADSSEGGANSEAGLRRAPSGLPST